jgi:tetratricopeptide (TPR) repeat protein
MARDSGAARASEDHSFGERYRVERLLGKGGMGAVYAALDRASGQRVALKCMHADASARALELFKREYQTLHGLRHPNIVQVYDYGSHEGEPFYTMELLEGSDLSQQAPLPWRAVCSYLRQIASLLGLLHARRLLHRDISPRNIWVLPDGHLKLIDFGALTPFGASSDVIGTPPFIAPEWLNEEQVDQRADLFALGALGYWLLTTAHAYPAKSVRELSSAWAREPMPPSSFTRASQGDAAIPADLDALILSLLRLERDARPETTEIVIARIDAIAGPVAEPSDHAIRGYVRSSAFVGRRFELHRFEQELKRANNAGAALLFEAPSGLGRSRLLDELAVLARLAGAVAISVRGQERARAHGVMNDLALGLLASLQKEAVAAARPNARTLAQLSPEVARALKQPVSDQSGARERLQQAFSEWVSALVRQRRLVLLIDDLQDADSESASWLASLARLAPPHLQLVAAVCKQPGQALRVEEQMYARVAQVLELQPLTAAQTHELMASVFGEHTAYLGRVSQSLYAACQGSPAHCLELVDHLVSAGLARYSEGTWTLPGQLSAADLPHSRSEMQRLRLTQLSGDARRLAELMTLHDGRLPRPACDALSELNASDTAAALVELTVQGVIDESEQGYAFTHESLRAALASSLEPERAIRGHAQLGAALLRSASDAIDGLRAGLHLFEAGDRDAGERLVTAAITALFQGQRARMHIAAPLLERALELYEQAGFSEQRIAPLLAVLAAASFFVDRRLSDRYGVRALDVLERVLRFDLARKLRPKLGGKLALLAALGGASLARIRDAQHVAKTSDLLRMHIGAAVALNGVATSSTDVALTERCVRAFDPLAALGDRHIAGFVRRCTVAVASILREDFAAALTELQTLAAIMDSGAPIRNFPEHLRREFLGGCLFSVGVLQCWRHDARALAIADRIESFSAMLAMNADHLRATYHTSMGDIAAASVFRKRAETLALQVGAAWQVVTVGPVEAQFAALWTHDVRLAKHASAEIERLSAYIPAMRNEAHRSRGLFLLLSGRYAEALDVMRKDDSPRTQAGFTRSRGLIARAHNRLGEYAKARELCQVALEGRSEEELSFVVMYLHAQLELAFAEAGLGELDRARERIERAAQRYAAAGPLALGAILETGLRIELIAHDGERCKAQLEALRKVYLPTQISSLIDLATSLGDAVARAERRGASGVSVAPLDDDQHLLASMKLALSHTELPADTRLQRALLVVREITGAKEALLLTAAPVERVVHLEMERPARELLDWARAQLEGEELSTVFIDDLTTHESSNDLTLGAVRYRAFPYFRTSASDQPTAVLVLGAPTAEPLRRLPPQVLTLLAAELAADDASD